MKKTLIGLGTIFSVATPIALVVACSNPGTQNKSRIAFIPDNSKIRGNQFLESTEAGVLAVDKNAQIITSETQVLIGNAYNTAVKNGANILVTTGFGHEAHIKEYASTHTSIKFIYVDGQIQAKNISSIYFNMKEISFIAGYRMAASNQVQNNKHSIGVYGAVNIPNVTEYINGVKAGVDYFNNHKPSGIQNDVTLEDGGFVGDFNVGGKSRTIAKSLVSKNDIVLSVGGGQWHDVMEEIKAETTHDTKLIGVDIDVAKTLKDQTGICMRFNTKRT